MCETNAFSHYGLAFYYEIAILEITVIKFWQFHMVQSSMNLKKIFIWLCWVLVLAHKTFVVVLGLSGWGAQAQWPHGIWDRIFPPPRIESMSPVLQGGFFFFN